MRRLRLHGLRELLLAPGLWAVHFLASYVTGAVHCARTPESALSGVRLLIAGFTAVALGLIALQAWRGYRTWREAARHEQHGDVFTDRARFMGLATLLLCLLSAVGVIYGTIPVLLLTAQGCGR